MDMDVNFKPGKLYPQEKIHIYYLDFRQDGLHNTPDSIEKTLSRSCLFVHPVYWSL
jgi:hypothetical protein